MSLEKKEDKTIYNSMLQWLRVLFISQFLQKPLNYYHPLLLPQLHQLLFHLIMVIQRLPFRSPNFRTPILFSLGLSQALLTPTFDCILAVV